MNLNEYFEEKKDTLAYLDLKSSITLSGKTMVLEESLPIETKTLVEKIQNGGFQEEISWEYFLRGIVKNIAIHEEFPFQKKYIELLYAWNDKVEHWIFNMALQNLKSEDGLLFLRALYRLNPHEPTYAAFYGKSLFQKAIILGQGKEKLWIEEAVHVLEESLNDKETFMALLTLGDIFSAIGFYVKADSYYRRGIEIEEDPTKQEILREKRYEVLVPAALEEGRLFVEQGKHEQALKVFLDAFEQEKDGTLAYWIGVAYQGVNALEKSLDYFQVALEKLPKKSEIINDMAVSYYLLKDYDQAINLLSQGIKDFPKEVRIKYNLMILLLQIGNKERSKILFEELEKLAREKEIEDEGILSSMEELKALWG